MNKWFFLLVLKFYGKNNIKKIFKIKNIIESKSWQIKKLDYKIEDILENYWNLKIQSIQGYAINKYTGKVQNILIKWHWQKKYFWMKLMMDNNTWEGNHIIFSNKNSFDTMNVIYKMNNMKKYFYYNMMKLRYLQFKTIDEFSLKDNNLNFVRKILDNDHQEYFRNLQLSIKFLGYNGNYDIFFIDHKKFNIFFIIKKEQLKYFIIYKKFLPIHKIFIGF